MNIEFSTVTERDVDLLLVEEFASDNGFLDWFTMRTGLGTGFRLDKVGHSVSQPSGESDLELTLTRGNETTVVLIEDKIDAPLQPRQAERYLDRARGYLRDGKCSNTSSILVAPRKYAGDPLDARGFDGVVTYEDLVEWLESSNQPVQRRLYKLSLLRTAIERGVAGWQKVPDPKVTQFCRQYWALARELAPELNLKDPGDRPANSSWLEFKPVGLPKATTLIHKVVKGCVDLQFAGGGSRMPALSQRYGPHLLPGMTLERAQKSAVIRIDVPPMDITGPFDVVEPKVRESLWAARFLALWVRAQIWKEPTP